jgi:two-component system nitrogen regulation sensor histidine kinase NtrY
VPEFSSDSLIQSYVATFDDVTELLSAQRKAAWADVARRIAHEIKNPLTPIQLSAERLKRKYLKEIQTDPAIFQGCIDTIVRQVNHIGRLIGEFSAFARMPEPVLIKENLAELCRQAIFLQQQAHQDVTFNVTIPEHVDFLCDAQQIGQVLTNLLQNGLDALEAQKEKVVYVNIITKNDEITLIIADNGPGFPLQYKDRLTEPYFTMKEKGTGLGLAIVLKIVQDHKGTLELSNGPNGGAAVIIRFSSNVTKH